MKNIKKFELKYGNMPLSYNVEHEFDNIDKEKVYKPFEIIDYIRKIYLKQEDNFMSSELKKMLSTVLNDATIFNKFFKDVLYLSYLNIDKYILHRRIFIICKYLIENIKFDIKKLDVMNNSELSYPDNFDLLLFLCKKGLINKIGIDVIHRIQDKIGSNLPHSSQYAYYFIYIYLLDNLSKSKIDEYEKKYGKLRTKEKAHDNIMYLVNYNKNIKKIW